MRGEGEPHRAPRGGEAVSPRALVVPLAALLACAAGRATPAAAPAAPPATAPATGMPDRVLGLSRVSVFDVPAPPPVKQNDSAPGELPVLPRPYALAPPRIPHGIDGFLPITRAQNSCLDCHEVKEKKKGEPTPIPPSHYRDLRRAPGLVGEKVSGARWVCTACHVPRTEAEPLVESQFRP